ncbi:MAG: Mur ligase family protein [Candidatus Microsaccharimonas sp.]
MSVVPIISVTGTKGKTTTVSVIADVLLALQKNVLKVDTTGHFLNGERRSTLEESKAAWRLVPSVAPGRYLWEFHAQPELKENGVAVLECSLGCSAASGLAYRYHKVGVFLNVFEDHLGSSDRIQTKEDIARAKEFIFSRLLHQDSYAVFNADDALVVDRLQVAPKIGVNLVPFGLHFSEFNLASHLENGGVAVTLNDNKEVVLRTKEGDRIVVNLVNIPWTFDAKFMPSIWNMMASVGALYGFFDGTLPEGTREAFEAVRLDPYGGRLTLLENEAGVKILADYAHEKISLGMVAELAKTKVAEGGKVIGVVRLAHDRTDELMRETGEVIGNAYDQLVVYDKIDGHFRKAAPKNTKFVEVDGRTSRILADAIASVNPNVERIVREDEALQRAAEIAQPGDVVVVIVNDDIVRSIGFIKEYFKADFI